MRIAAKGFCVVDAHGNFFYWSLATNRHDCWKRYAKGIATNADKDKDWEGYLRNRRKVAKVNGYRCVPVTISAAKEKAR